MSGRVSNTPGLIATAVALGFFEATLSAVIPDVLISTVALFSPRRAVRLALWAVLGAMAGGALVHAWAARSPQAARTFVTTRAGASAAMSAQASKDLEKHGGAGLCLGPYRGIPYKVYAVETPRFLDGPRFLLWSVPARLWRLLVNVLIFAAYGLAFAQDVRRRPRRAVALSLLFWLSVEGTWLALAR